jgi:uncharacterized protein YerC
MQTCNIYLKKENKVLIDMDNFFLSLHRLYNTEACLSQWSTTKSKNEIEIRQRREKMTEVQLQLETWKTQEKHSGVCYSDKP